jgi:hypothetical protein
MKSRNLSILFFILFTLFISNVSVAQKRSKPCDTTLWKHVVRPEKFIVKQSCVTVSGTIVSLEIKKDGDEHILLKPDTDYEKLVNERNIKKQKGCLVVEIICANTTADPEAKTACRGYTNTITIPQKGDHVSATGTLVLDKNHAWLEIHPATSIIKLTQ